MFTSDIQGFTLTEKTRRDGGIVERITVNSVSREIVYKDFNRLSSSEVHYWKLPAIFIGDKVTSYGGSLNYTVRYVPQPGGRSSPNNAPDVVIRVNLISINSYLFNLNRFFIYILFRFDREITFKCFTTDDNQSMQVSPSPFLFQSLSNTGNVMMADLPTEPIFSWSLPTLIRSSLKLLTPHEPPKLRMVLFLLNSQSFIMSSFPLKSDVSTGCRKCHLTLLKSATRARNELWQSNSALVLAGTRVSRAKIAIPDLRAPFRASTLASVSHATVTDTRMSATLIPASAL